MARPMTPDQTLAAMKKWKVPYKEYPGWKTRGRDPEHGPFIDVHGIGIHHTGSDSGQTDDYLKFLFVDGRPADGIPGPLCNVATDMDGDLHLGAQGRANHAGSGSMTVYNHIKNEDYDGYKVELKPGPDGVDGNAVLYGNEVRYDGGQPMTPAQYHSTLLWAAAVCDFHGWSALAAIGHREWTRRKIDPGNCPMTRFRTDLAAMLRLGPSGPVVSEPPKDITITTSCITRLADKHLGVSGACLVDNQQVMNIATYLNPQMAITTRPYFWAMCSKGNWVEAAKMMTYAIKVIQSKAGIKQDGIFGPLTAASLRTRGYIVK